MLAKSIFQFLTKESFIINLSSTFTPLETGVSNGARERGGFWQCWIYSINRNVQK